MNSRGKGARCEREWTAELREAGWSKARRGQQYAGGAESPDVICPELSFIHWEVKHCERGNPFEFMAQAVSDAGAGKLPVMAFRRNRHPFLVILRAADAFALLRNSNLDDVQRECAESARQTP